MIKEELCVYIEGREFSVDVVTRSLAWCYLKALTGGSLPIETRWADLDVKANVGADASRVFFGPPNDGFLDEELVRAHQVSFEQSLVLFERDKHRPISVAHYLLSLAVGFRNDLRLTSSLKTAISRFFSNRKHAGYKMLMNYKKVPELKEVVRIAERMVLH
jgi:hypothetical protein